MSVAEELRRQIAALTAVEDIHARTDQLYAAAAEASSRAAAEHAASSREAARASRIRAETTAANHAKLRELDTELVNDMLYEAARARRASAAAPCSHPGASCAVSHELEAPAREEAAKKRKVVRSSSQSTSASERIRLLNGYRDGNMRSPSARSQSTSASEKVRQGGDLYHIYSPPPRAGSQSRSISEMQRQQARSARSADPSASQGESAPRAGSPA